MRSVQVVGRFVDSDGLPLKGRVKFSPSRLWVTEEEVAWATLHADEELVEGRFAVELTPTHGHDDFAWHYTLDCPAGRWTIRGIPDTKDVIFLADFLPARFSK